MTPHRRAHEDGYLVVGRRGRHHRPRGFAAGALRCDRLVVPGVGPTEEVDSRLLGWAANRGLSVELPNGGQAAGQFSFDAMERAG